MSANIKHDKTQNQISQQESDLAYKQARMAVIGGGIVGAAGLVGGAAFGASAGGIESIATSGLMAGALGAEAGGIGGIIVSDLATRKERTDLGFNEDRLRAGIMYDEIYSKLPAGATVAAPAPNFGGVPVGQNNIRKA